MSNSDNNPSDSDVLSAFNAQHRTTAVVLQIDRIDLYDLIEDMEYYFTGNHVYPTPFHKSLEILKAIYKEAITNPVQLPPLSDSGNK